MIKKNKGMKDKIEKTIELAKNIALAISEGDEVERFRSRLVKITDKYEQPFADVFLTFEKAKPSYFTVLIHEQTLSRAVEDEEDAVEEICGLLSSIQDSNSDITMTYLGEEED